MRHNEGDFHRGDDFSLNKPEPGVPRPIQPDLGDIRAEQMSAGGGATRAPALKDVALGQLFSWYDQGVANLGDARHTDDYFNRIDAEIKKRMVERYRNKEGKNISIRPGEEDTKRQSVDLLRTLRSEGRQELVNHVLDTEWDAWIKSIRAHYGDKAADTIEHAVTAVYKTPHGERTIGDDREAREFFRLHVFSKFQGLYTYGELNKNYADGINFYDYVSDSYKREAFTPGDDLPTRIRELSEDGREAIAEVVRRAARANTLLGLSQDLGKRGAEVYVEQINMAIDHIGSVFTHSDRVRLERYQKTHTTFKEAMKWYTSGYDAQRSDLIFTPLEMVDMVNLTVLKYDVAGLIEAPKKDKTTGKVNPDGCNTFAHYIAELQKILNTTEEHTTLIKCVEDLRDKYTEIEGYTSAGADVADLFAKMFVMVPQFDKNHKNVEYKGKMVNNRWLIVRDMVGKSETISSTVPEDGFHDRFGPSPWIGRVPRNFQMRIRGFDRSDKLGRYGFGSYEDINALWDFFSLGYDEQRKRADGFITMFDYLKRVRAARKVELMIVTDMATGVKGRDFLARIPEYIKEFSFQNIDMYKWLALGPLIHAANLEFYPQIRGDVLETQHTINMMENTGAFNVPWLMYSNVITGTPVMERHFQWDVRDYATHVALGMLPVNVMHNPVLLECGWRRKKDPIIKMPEWVNRLRGQRESSMAAALPAGVELLDGFDTPFYLLESWLRLDPEFRGDPVKAVQNFLEYAGVRWAVEGGKTVFRQYRDGEARRGYRNSDNTLIRDALEIAGIEAKYTSFLNKTAGTRGAAASPNGSSIMPDVRSSMDMDANWLNAAKAMLQYSDHRWKGNSLRELVKFANNRMIPFFQPYLGALTRDDFTSINSMLNRIGINARDSRIVRFFEGITGQGYFGGPVRDFDAILNTIFMLRGEMPAGLVINDPNDQMNRDYIKQIFSIVKIVPDPVNGGYVKVDEDDARYSFAIDGIEGFRGVNSCVPVDGLLRGWQHPRSFLDARIAGLVGGMDVSDPDITRIPFLGVFDTELTTMMYLAPHTFPRLARNAIRELVAARAKKEGSEKAVEWFNTIKERNPEQLRRLIQEQMVASPNAATNIRRMANLKELHDAIVYIKNEKWASQDEMEELLMLVGATGYEDITRNPTELEGAFANNMKRRVEIGLKDRDLSGRKEQSSKIAQLWMGFTKQALSIPIFLWAAETFQRNIPMTWRTIAWGTGAGAVGYVTSAFLGEGALAVIQPFLHGAATGLAEIPVAGGVAGFLDGAVGWINPFILSVPMFFVPFLRQQEKGDNWFNRNYRRRKEYGTKQPPESIIHDGDEKEIEAAGKAVVSEADKHKLTRNTIYRNLK